MSPRLVRAKIGEPALQSAASRSLACSTRDTLWARAGRDDRMRRDMTKEKTVSRRALAVLRLLRHAPWWRIEWVWFTASSFLTVDDVRWTMDRSISATDA